MDNNPVYRLSALLAAVALMYTAATAGVCLCPGGAAGGKADACIVSLDVCGTAGQPASMPAIDAALAPDCNSCQFFPVVSLIPPSPAMAVASAEAGVAEKPPEA